MDYTPQINFPSPKPRTANQPARRRSTTEFAEYLKNWEMHIRRDQDRLRANIEIAVMLHRRFRGLTMNDLCGFFGTRPTTQGRWIDYDATLDGEIHPIQIVQPAMRANTNACLQANPAIEVASANQSARHKQIAMRWQRVADYFNRTQWDESQRGVLFDGIQKAGTYLVYSHTRPVGSQKAPQVEQNKYGLAVYNCAYCGSRGLSESTPETGMRSIDCPKCGGPANANVKPLDGYEVNEAEIPVFQIKHEIIPFFNFAIDRYGARIEGIPGAKWLQIHQLVDRAELETAYPHIEFPGAMRWSYALQCEYALASGDWRFLNYRAQPDSGFSEFQKFERKWIYLHEEAYANYVAPSKYKFVDGKGRVTFELQEGETIPEAYQRMYGDNPEGLKFVWVDENVIEICSPEDCEVNFRRCYSDIHWLRDSASYVSAPYKSIIEVQDDITQLNTMNHNIVARNAATQVVYDSTVWPDASEFSKEYLGTQNAALLPDRDVSKSVFQIPVPTPSPYLSNQLQFLFEIKDTITQVQPAMRGEAQKGETFGAQRQQLEQSYGLLTSVLKSFAGCMIASFKQKAALASKVWTLEQFQEVGSMFGEIWTEEDVAEMTDIDFEKELLVSYQNGSEMPETQIDREMKFVQGLQHIFNMLGGPEGVLQVLGPEKLTKLLQKVDEFAGFDFDLTGLEVTDLIAQKRFIELASICKRFGQPSFEQIEMARQQVLAIDGVTGEPVTQLDLIAEQVFAQSKIRFSQFEKLLQQKAFFIEQFNAETGKTSPDYLLLEMLQILVGMIDAALAMQEMEAQAADPDRQAENEAREADRQAAAEQQAVDRAAAEEQAAREAEAREADRAEKREEREAQAAQADRQFAQGALMELIGHEAELEKIKAQSKARPSSNK